MKNIWKYGHTGGEYAGKVLDDMLVSIPYTDQLSPEGICAGGEPLTIVDQAPDPKLNQRIVLANALDYNDLNSLKAVYEVLEHENDNLKQLNAELMLNDVAIRQENTALKEKADSLVQISSKTMLASPQNSKDIVETKKQLNPESEGGG